MVQIKRYLNKNSIKIVMIFLASVLVYGIIVSLFTSTVHIDTDEETYLTLAKTFHYYGKFELQKQVTNSSYILYSIVISLAYYIYNPSTILFTIRLMGVVMICSSIFPIWLLASEILEDKKQAMGFSIFMMIMPYMYNCGYIMQEVLSFPLFMWFVYFLWKYIKCDERFQTQSRMFLIVMGFFSACCFLTKTYMMFIPVAVNIWMLFKFLESKRDSKYIKHMLLYSGVVICIVLLVSVWVLSTNDFVSGDSHYQRIIRNIFPISVRTLWGVVQDSIIYISLLLINMGLFPVLGLISYYHKRKGVSRDLSLFCIISIPLLVFEIIFLIVLGEESIVGIPRKFVFRFFQIFIPPFFLLFYRIRNELQIFKNKTIYIVSGIVIMISGIYFFALGGNSRQAIMDGYIYLILENVTKYILPYGDVLGIVLLGMSILFLGRVYLCPSKQKFVIIMIIFFFVTFWLVNLVQLPIYTNSIAGGTAIQNDGIKIAEYINDNTVEDVYYYDGANTNYYLQNFYAYIQQDYVKVEAAELPIIVDSIAPIVLVVPQSETLDSLKLQKVDIDISNYDIYSNK